VGVIDADQEVRASALRRDLGRRQQLAAHDELRVIDKILARLEVGRAVYGPLDLSIPRNWRNERFEERLDALVYDVAEELAAEDVAHAAVQEAARIEILEWQAEQRTAISTEPARIALDDIADREPYFDFDLSEMS
jgi:hypothetical protein